MRNAARFALFLWLHGLVVGASTLLQGAHPILGGAGLFFSGLVFLLSFARFSLWPAEGGSIFAAAAVTATAWYAVFYALLGAAFADLKAFRAGPFIRELIAAPGHREVYVPIMILWAASLSGGVLGSLLYRLRRKLPNERAA